MTSVDCKIIDKLKGRYPIHPLLFQRSVEYAETAGELFDILDSIPELPIVWDGEIRRWKKAKDLSLSYRISILKGE
jgi:hypothetical protein